MFDTLTSGFKDAALKLQGHARLTPDNIAEPLERVRTALLDGDVDLKVVKSFLESIKSKVTGEVVQLKSKSGQKVSAGDHFVKLCHDELIELLGQNTPVLAKNPKGPTVVLLVGLQGAGKTTHAAKIAKHLAARHNWRPLLVAADVYRPAARDQLKVLAERIEVPFFTLETQDAVEIARKGVEKAREEWRDLVIIDTAGRLAIDDTLMSELEAIKAAVQPQNTLLVIDAMIGQDAVRTASAFDQRLNLTGVVLTKLDGDTRGGAALSVKTVTQKGILYVGTGEALDRLEDFRAEGMAGRILGMGDIVGLMQDFENVIDQEKAARSAEKMLSGQGMDFDDFFETMQSIQKMGPLKDIISKTPLGGQLSSQDLSKVDDRELVRIGAIIQSMTRQERKNPELLTGNKSLPVVRSRITRIAKGSGRAEKDVRDLIDRFAQMRQMMSLMMGFGGGGGLGGLLGKIPGLGGLNQMANMARMMKQMGGGGMPGIPPGMEGLMGGGAVPRGLSNQDLAEINRQKKAKKEEKKRRK